MAALGSEIMALSVYGMYDEENKNKDDVLKAMADVFVQNMTLQRELGISSEELSEAFTKRLDEMLPKIPIEEANG